MAAPFNTTRQPKYGLGNASDGLRNVLPGHEASDGLRIALSASVASGQQVYPRRSAFDELIIAPPASTSTSAESKPSSGMEHLAYDVFINHCGPDTKNTVAKSIYNKLDATGLRVFLDKDELKLGDFFPDTVEKAMRSASVYIAIFSQNYAQSAGCLAELAFIMKLPNIIFIPIFYNVEPATLRWAIEGKGIYADAFSEHEKKRKRDGKEIRYSSEKLESWELALHKASFYTGYIINDQRDEEKVVANVVNRVLKELEKIQLDVAEHPVGLDEVEQDFHDKIALQSAGPIKMVGIWGMGGVGKTTLAKRLYNRKCSTYQRSSFLFDVREAAGKGLLLEKQKWLLKDLGFKGHAVFGNVDQGKEILRGPLRSLSVLIVLDDVDHPDQLDALLPDRESLGYGSLVIITTRELSVLKARNISTIYKIRALHPAHAEQLFCWHAFGQPSPLFGFKELVQKFIYACYGLPLLLKVLGGLLCGESSEKYWQSQLNKLSRILPDDIERRLKISYDALDGEEKEMFLDVACFFIGCTSSRAIAIWDGSGWNGLHGWQRLVNKCLVELDEDNLVRMHDHLRDLGREIANQQSPYRLWSKRQIIEIRPQQEAIRIRGMANAVGDNCYLRQGKIIIRTSQGERILQPWSLGLKIYVGDGDFINQEGSEISRELVWLQCNEFEHKYFPLWLSLKNLRVLELFNCWNLKDLWERDADAPLQLRELVIQRCQKLENIKGFKSLRSLKTLRIRDCPELNGLPCLGELTSLEELELERCDKLEKIECIENLRSLEILRINYCPELNGIPSLGGLKLLKKIELQMCHKLEEVESLENLRSLETLEIRDCAELNELPSLGELTSLRKFRLQRCHKLKKIKGLENLRSLESLKIRECPELNDLPSLGELASLKTFELQMCHKLEEVESLKYLRSLETLKIRDCAELNELPSLGELTSLTKFRLQRCHKLKKIEGLENLRSLESLKIRECPELNDLPSLGELISLKTFKLQMCHKLEEVESLKYLRSLEILKIRDCAELNELLDLGELTSLRKFELQRCHKLKEIEGLESLRSLETLEIRECPELNDLPNLEELTSLKTLELQRCHKLEEVESLKYLRSLETLKIRDCAELNELPSLGELTSLRKFELQRCDKLKKIKGLENLRSLESLKIRECPELNDLPSLGELISLKTFELQRCHKLEEVESLKYLWSLETLNIRDCAELNELPSLGELTSLKIIELQRCHKLKKIEGLESLRSLEKLEVHGLWNAPCMVSLESSERLKSLIVVANDISAVEPFVSNVQKWPREVIICTRVVFDVEALKNLFEELPNVSVLDYSNMLQRESDGMISLRRPESSTNADAILICFIIDCSFTDLHFSIYSREVKDSFITELGKGKWVWMGVFTQGSSWLRSDRETIETFSEGKHVEVKVEEAWLVMGEEGSILEAFNQLFPRKLPRNIKQQLQLSYDVLDDKEREMFLDTACFFIGEEKSLAIAVWDGSEWNGLQGWDSLINKELIYLDENNRIRMHHHWRDLGRELAEKQSPPYRLWSPWHFNKIQSEQRDMEIRGMINATDANASSSQGKITINTNEGFRSLTPSLLGLKLLVCSGQFLTEEVGELSRELLWLRWDDFKHTNLPPWLSLKNLRVLELNGALDLQELWTDDAHAPLQLRELIISGTWSASFERFPSSISNLNHLIKIALLGDVDKEFGIKLLPEEFCDLQSLRYLELRHCTLLSSLPARFGDLRSLRHLDLCYCKELRILPNSFKQLRQLEYLDLSGCKKLALQRDILENITELKNVNLSGCHKLRQLPHQITDQACLRKLRLEDTRLEDLPTNIGQLRKLELLTIGSPFLTNLPVSLGDLSSLRSLSIIDCIDLESLHENLGRLTLLEHLCIESSELRSLPEGFTELANIKTFKISGCPLSELDFGSGSSSALSNLRVIEIIETCVARISITEDCCPSLETLHIGRNDYLEEINIVDFCSSKSGIWICFRVTQD